MRTHAMIVVATLATLGSCSGKGDEAAGDQPEQRAPAQTDDEEKAPVVAKPSTFEVSLRREGSATVSMKVPEGWVENERIRVGKGWRFAESDDVWLTVGLNCSGECAPDQIPGNVQPIIEAKRKGDPRIGPNQPSNETAGVEQEVIEDTALEGGHLIARRFTPPKEVMDPPKPMLEVFCYQHQKDIPVYVSVTGEGPVQQAGPFEEAMIEACRSLEIVGWKPEE